MSRPQNTIARSAEVSGTALFSGRPVHVQLLPAETSTGLLFVRADLPDRPVVPATVEAVGDGFRCTALSWNNVEVNVVEHVLAACAGLQVDNLIIEVDGEELPALGGCATEYARALSEAGVVEQNAERHLLKLEEPISVSRGGATIVATPHDDGLSLSYVLELSDGVQRTEALTLPITPETFLEELAPARTFGLEGDYEEFRRQSLGGGITDENTYVLCRDGTVKKPLSGEPAELRFPDEAVRHKMLDVLGDMALANTDLEGKILAFRSGHKLNADFAGQLRQLVEAEAGPQRYLDIAEIRRTLPHRYPFLMVDRILRFEGENKVVGLKNVSINEEFFQGHYPEYPIMPGVLQLEALAQTAGVLLLRKLEHTGKVAMMVSMDGVKLRRAVMPGDQLVLEAEAVRIRSRSATIRAKGTVNDQVACEAEMGFMLVDADAI